MPLPACPSVDVLNRYAAGDLDDDSASALDAHLATCETCLSVLDSGTPPDSAFAGLRGLAPGPSSAYGRVADKLTNADRPVPSIPGYQILEPLGQGGMGTVYKAVHAKLGKTVAIKVLRGARDRAAVARFEREMMAVGRLDHPHVVRATDAGEARGEPYLVMEYVPGTDFAKLVKSKGPLPAETAKRYVAELAAGLAAAHAAGMVHRDVKPSNAMLTDTGTVKLLDLGLALLPPASPSDDTTPVRAVGAGLTLAGKAMGTKDYMAPEQQTNPRDADARADVYGLGATLWFLLTGSPPPRPLPDDMPDGVSRDVWRKFLADDPALRFASVADAITAFRPGRPGPVKMWPRLRGPALAGFAVVTVLIAVALVFALRPRESSNPTPPGDTPPRPRAPDSGRWPFDEARATALQRAWADYYRVPVVFVDRLGMRYALIPPGEFEHPTEFVRTITKPYYLGLTEVPVGHFDFFVKFREYKTEAEDFGVGGTPVPTGHATPKLDARLTWKTPGYPTVTERHPVTQVSWVDANKYCEFLTQTSSTRFRLPTEAEWVWAAAAGVAEPDLDRTAVPSPNQLGWSAFNAKQPQPVGQLFPNAFGLYDTFGNVSEWCHDFYADFPVGRYENYAGPDSHPKQWHVLQGTAFHSVVTQRWKRWRANSCGDQVGFRVLREIP